MNKISLTNKHEVYVVGDIHGYIADFADDVVSKVSNSLIFLVGDIGLGMYNPGQTQMELFYLEDICRKKENIVIGIRGNHDNPAFFNNLEKKSKAMKDYLQHVLFVEDYTIVETYKGNVLCIGGAISTDRNLREKVSEDHDDGGLVWFENEAVDIKDLTPLYGPKLEVDDGSDDEEDVDVSEFSVHVNHKKISTLLTHTAPSCAFPPAISLSDSVAEDIVKEREYLTSLKDYINERDNNILVWVYGHFHTHHTDMIKGTKYIALDRYRDGKFDITEL